MQQISLRIFYRGKTQSGHLGSAKSLPNRNIMTDRCFYTCCPTSSVEKPWKQCYWLRNGRNHWKPGPPIYSPEKYCQKWSSQKICDPKKKTKQYSGVEMKPRDSPIHEKTRLVADQEHLGQNKWKWCLSVEELKSTTVY